MATFHPNETVYCRFTGIAHTVITCDGVVANLADGTGRIVGELTRTAPRRHRLRPGECTYCDGLGADEIAPPHDASPRCESFKRAHCTCDTCF